MLRAYKVTFTPRHFAFFTNDVGFFVAARTVVTFDRRLTTMWARRAFIGVHWVPSALVNHPYLGIALVLRGGGGMTAGSFIREEVVGA
jgi:hypothetical protein